MKKFLKLITMLVVTANYTLAQTTVGLFKHDAGTLDDGYVLFAPMTNSDTYLINKCGEKVKTWPSTHKPGLSCYLLPNGNLLRAGNVNNTTFTSGGKGGIIEQIDWDGKVVWCYGISSTSECQHHDIKPLPNGNILAIVWESKTRAQAIEQGRNPTLTTTNVWSEKVIEIKPTGTTGGTIVWEWHLWDHLIQNFDNTKANFGEVKSNPQRLNINFNASSNAANGSDWIHMNSIDYNETLDQIVLSSHNLHEIWIIDHSTTTAEAAGHTGGKAKKGGDFLYRWGNPQAYDNGSDTDQMFFGQHNANWIEKGFPNQDQIMVYNNGNGRMGGNYSTVEIINTPVDGFAYFSTLPFLPERASWMYNDKNTDSLYSQNISGASQLSNGNVLFCDGPSGTFNEVDSTGALLWQYINPVRINGITPQGAKPLGNTVFRCSFYSSDYVGIKNQNLTPTGTIENTNEITAKCTLTLATTNIEQTIHTFKLFPNPTNRFLYLTLPHTNGNSSCIEIWDNSGRLRYSKLSLDSANKLEKVDVSNFEKGLFMVVLKSDNNLLMKKFIIE